jgi:acetyl esterase
MTLRPFNPAFWALTQIGSRVRFNPSAVRHLATTELPDPQTVLIPTRHGNIRALVIRPLSSDGPTPVVMHLHGGGYINRNPEQDQHFARHFAAELGAVVVLPDYETAPKVSYPVAEEEMLDVARWIRTSDADHGWDGENLLLSGVSAGAKLAINVCQQLHAAGETRPLALSLTVPVTDVTDTPRTSPISNPAISPFVLRMVRWAYFPDAGRRGEALASPRFDPSLAASLPPTIVQTGGNDSLATEGAELAHVLTAAGVEVVHREYPGADHGFYAEKPVETVRALLTEITTFFTTQLSRRK